jgi:hypothetical protein
MKTHFWESNVSDRLATWLVSRPTGYMAQLIQIPRTAFWEVWTQKSLHLDK